jgi:hypothetical protein
VRTAGFFLILHILTWGAIGASLSPRAGLPRGIGASIAVVLPILGSIVLFALWFRRSAAPRVPSLAGGAKSGIVAVVAGLTVAVSVWLPWVSLEVAGEAPGIREQSMAVSSQDLGPMVVTGTPLGLLIAVAAALAIRRGNQLWVIPVALLAWLPAAVAAVVILLSAPVGGALDRAEDVGELIQDVIQLDVEVDTEYQVGPGAYVGLVGAMVALGWGFVWSMGAWRRSPSVATQPPSQAVPVADPYPQSGMDWLSNERKPDPDWDTW